MDNTQLEHIKANLLCELRSYLPKVQAQLTAIDTRLRCEDMLANVFMCIHKLRTGEEPIKPLKKD